MHSRYQEEKARVERERGDMGDIPVRRTLRGSSNRAGFMLSRRGYQSETCVFYLLVSQVSPSSSSRSAVMLSGAAHLMPSPGNWSPQHAENVARHALFPSLERSNAFACLSWPKLRRPTPAQQKIGRDAGCFSRSACPGRVRVGSRGCSGPPPVISRLASIRAVGKSKTKTGFSG